MKVKLNISNLLKFISNISYVIINMTQILKPLHRFVTDFQQIFSKTNLVNFLKIYFLKFVQISAFFIKNVLIFSKKIYI